MKTSLAVIVCAVVLALPVGAWAAAETKAAQRKNVVTVSRSVTSAVVEVDRWGSLQVSLKVAVTTTTVGTKKTKTFKVTQVTFPAYPDHTDRSLFISRRALPVLRQELLQLKGRLIQLVSGATDTSYAFVNAVRSALTKAGV
jgi:uncharacterized protein with FMN-binding domain